MSAKHTPGPWHVDHDDKHGQAVVRNDHIEIATCWHHSVGAIEKEMRHNARLIAAAPDLYEALNLVLDGLGALTKPHELDEYIGPDAATVWAALAKAHGEQK